jgi:hypothetical protein
MKFVKEQLYSPVPFSGGTTQTLLIGPKSYWIVGLILDYRLDYQTGTTPSLNQDAAYRGIQALTLQGGGRPYIKIGSPDARSLYWDTRLRLRGRAKPVDIRLPASQSTSLSWYHTLPVLFTPNPILANDHLNLYDNFAGVAPDPDLTLTVSWAPGGSTSSSSVFGTNIAVQTTGFLRVTLLGVVPEKGSEEPRYFPVWQSAQWAPPQTYSSLTGTQQLTPGFWYRRTAILTLKGAPNSDNRDDGLAGNAVSEIGVLTADGRRPINMKTVDLAQESQSPFTVADDNQAQAEAGSQGATLVAGVTSAVCGYNPGACIIDWAQQADTSNPLNADPVLGLNLTNKANTAVQLAFTVDNNTNVNIVMFHEAYSAY